MATPKKKEPSENLVIHTPDGEMPDVPDRKGQTSRPEDPVRQFEEDEKKKKAA